MNLKEKIIEQKIPAGSLFKGFSSIFNALGLLIKQKGFGKYFYFPFLMNIVILSTLFYFSYININSFVEGFLQGSAWWLEFLRAVLKPFLFIILSLITIIIYTITGTILTAPFNDMLSLRVEKTLTDADFEEKFNISVFIKDILRISSNIIKLLFLIIAINLLALLINLVPVAGQIIYSIISFLFAGFFIGFQFFDFPLDRRRLSFSDKLKITLRFKYMVCGLGMAFYLLSYIPLLGFLGLNLATIGATKLFIDYMKPEDEAGMLQEK